VTSVTRYYRAGVRSGNAPHLQSGSEIILTDDFRVSPQSLETVAQLGHDHAQLTALQDEVRPVPEDKY
jgi:hypothetical protein